MRAIGRSFGLGLGLLLLLDVAHAVEIPLAGGAAIDTQQQGRPVIASGETDLLAVWREGPSVFAKRLAPDGSPLDAAPVRLAERGTPAGIVFNGTDYIVIWQQPNGQPYSQDLWTARVPGHGPLRVDGGARMPNAQLRAAAGNGTATVLLWDSGEGLGESVNASRLNGDGTFLDTVPLMLETAEGIGRVALAASDGDFLVVWEDYGPEPYFHYPPAQSVMIRGSRLSPDLVLRDGGGFVISAATPLEREPAVTWNGEAWLVVWLSAAGWSPDQIRGRFVARDGTLDDEPAGVVIVNGGRNPSVTWDGARYFITWQISHAWGLPLLPDTLHAGWFPNLGSPVVSEKSLALGYLDVSVAAIGPGRVATVYARTVADAALGDVSQAFLNLVTHLPRRHAAR